MGKFNFIKTDIPEVQIIEPTVFGDDRGYFMETYQIDDFAAAGIDKPFVQDNQSRSTKGVLRGGGDTRFLMLADMLFLWLASIPLGYLCGLVWKLDAFWVYAALKVDWIIKSIWCIFRLKSKKWIRVVSD